MSRSSPVATQREDGSLGVHPSEEESRNCPYSHHSFAARTSLERKDAAALLLFIPHQWIGYGQSVALEGWLGRGEQKMCCIRKGLSLLLSSSKAAV